MTAKATGQTLSRRAVLAGAAGVATSLAGCSTTGSGRPVSVLSAGSLHVAFTEGLPDRTGHEVRVESHGSRRAAQMVAAGQRDPDILALADAGLFESVLSAPWYATFASNAVVLAYDPDSTGGERIVTADRWFEPLLSSDVALGRTDPDLDPLGYRTLLTLSLAGEYYGVDDLRERVVAPDQVYPETQLLAGFETGSVDAAFVYRNMAVERDYPYVDLPAEVDLGDPNLADHYASVSVTLSDGTSVQGEPIAYGARLRSDSEATGRTATDASQTASGEEPTASGHATDVFETAVVEASSYLESYGFEVRDDFPTYHGDVPARIAQ